jgi:capsular exopolysaccharide synthesis family protein
MAHLGIIPKVPETSDLHVELLDPRSSLSEAYRSLATSLQFATDRGLPKTILITSCGPGEGKSVTSIAIARHFATIGLKVLIIDADLRNASIHKKLQVDNSKGLSNYLIGAATPPECFMKTDLPLLTVMASGPLPPNPAELLMSAQLSSLLTVGLQVFDLIVVDGPPVMGLADAPLLSSAVSATVLVVSSGETRKGLAVASIRRLQQARAHLIGSVLTKFDARTAGYGYGYGYGYGSGYGYGYGYGSGNPPTLAGSLFPLRSQDGA